MVVRSTRVQAEPFPEHLHGKGEREEAASVLTFPEVAMWCARSWQRRRLEVSCRLSGRTCTSRRGPERSWPRGCG